MNMRRLHEMDLRWERHSVFLHAALALAFYGEAEGRVFIWGRGTVGAIAVGFP